MSDIKVALRATRAQLKLGSFSIQLEGQSDQLERASSHHIPRTPLREKTETTMVTRLKEDPHGPKENTPEAPQAFNGDLGRKYPSERRLAKPKTNSGTSLVSHRSSNRLSASLLVQPNDSISNADTLVHEYTPQSLEELHIPPQSLTTDASREKLMSNLKDVWSSVPLPTLKAHYKLHNPLGPRWYRNHLLIPPSHLKRSMRPPTFFSPSFPPIGTATPPDYLDEDEGLSRSPSHSPLPTPSSSQTRVQDGLKPRSRKTSQTAPDAVDLLDVSDPWGQSWHHQSPYEYGQTTTVACLDTNGLPNRTRCASFSVVNGRRRSIVPSPLSQSTSAINLQPSQPEIKLPRKLSKRKTTNVTTIFQNHTPQVDRKATSAPPTPVYVQVTPPADIGPSTTDTLPKRMSVAPAGSFMSTPSPTPKREKRGSILNRLVKKFSIMKKGSDSSSSRTGDWSYVEPPNTNASSRQSASGPEMHHLFPEKPFVNGISSADQPEEMGVHAPHDEDRASLTSLDIPYSAMGKLTIANPDPSEENEQVEVNQADPQEPIGEPCPLPEVVVSEPSPEPLKPADEEEHENIGSITDKPSAPQLATPRISRLSISEIMISPPQVMDQPLPPLPPKDIIKDPVPPAREATPSPPPSEQPKSPAIELAPLSIFNLSISLDHTAHDAQPSFSPPRQAQTSPETLKQSPSQRKASSPMKEVQERPDLERGHTQSPPAPTIAQRESPRNLSPHQSPNRNTESSTEATPPNKQQSGSQPSGHASISSRERIAEAPRSPPPRSNSRPELHNAPTLVQVPFPETHYLQPFPSSIDRSWQFSYTDSPLSASSMLANPPTPYDHRLSINDSDLSSPPPTVPPKSIRHQSPPPPPSKTAGSTTRQTETFKLVRSSSGNVYASNQTFLAQGQQWEVVESVDSAKRDKSVRSKENERRSKEQEREREIYREREREKEKEREERQRMKEQEREMERERKEMERAKMEMEVRRERERAKERERREAEREKERERERERVRQREKEKERERLREREREKERQREKEREREKRKERERREREREKEKERRREREQREREKERKRRKEREIERERAYEEELYRDRRSGTYDRKSREHDRKSREYEPRSRDYEPWTDGSEHRSRDDGRPREVDRRHIDYNNRPREPDHSRRRSHEKGSSRHHEDSRIHDERSRRDEHRKHDEYRDQRSTKHPTEVSSSSYSQPGPSVQASVPVDAVPVRLERNPSLSAARPTSQLASADEMNAVRAKEKWEMERLWKARSLHGLEPNTTGINFIPGPGSTSSLSDDIPEINPMPQIYGSSYTAYVVPAPFQDTRPQIYHSMPAAPPPIFYSSRASIPSIPDSLSSYEPYENLRSYPGPTHGTTASIPPALPPKSNNPLPEPPRESPYKAAPLSSISASKRRSTEYWTFDGITTTH